MRSRARTRTSMPRPPNSRRATPSGSSAIPESSMTTPVSRLFLAALLFAASALPLLAQEKKPSPRDDDKPPHQSTREATLSKMLSGATLEGSYTASGPGADPSKINREKYTLGEVK